MWSRMGRTTTTSPNRSSEKPWEWAVSLTIPADRLTAPCTPPRGSHAPPATQKPLDLTHKMLLQVKGPECEGRRPRWLGTYRVPGQEGPSPQRQAGHELDGQTGTAVSCHQLGVAMGPGHVQDQVGPAERGRSLRGLGSTGKDPRVGQGLTAGSAEAPPWPSGSSLN